MILDAQTQALPAKAKSHMMNCIVRMRHEGMNDRQIAAAFGDVSNIQSLIDEQKDYGVSVRTQKWGEV